MRALGGISELDVGLISADDCRAGRQNNRPSRSSHSPHSQPWVSTLACGELVVVRIRARDVLHASPDLEHMAEATCARRLPASVCAGVEEAGGEPCGCPLVVQVGD